VLRKVRMMKLRVRESDRIGKRGWVEGHTLHRSTRRVEDRFQQDIHEVGSKSINVDTSVLSIGSSALTAHPVTH